MTRSDRAAQIREAIRRRGWSVRSTPTDLGYLAEARREGQRPEGPAPWGAGATEVEALEELAVALSPFHRAH